MRNFKKTITGILIAAAVFVGVSLFIMLDFIGSHYRSDFDFDVRENLAGQIDTVYIGMSQFQRAIVTTDADELLGVSGYNLSDGFQNLYASRLLMQRMIEQNEIKTAVIEVSKTVLSADYAFGYEGAIYAIPRLADWDERLDYIEHCIPADRYLQLLGNYMQMGTEYELNKLRGRNTDDVVPENKGYFPYDIVEDKRLDEAAARRFFGIYGIPDFYEENLNDFKALVQLCRDNGIKVYAAITPSAESYLLRFSGFDEYEDDVRSLMNEMNIPFVDFNLMKNRFEIFDEESCFADDDHLSDKGARIFAPYFCGTIKSLTDGSEPELSFYGSYKEMMLDGPYAYLYSEG